MASLTTPLHPIQFSEVGSHPSVAGFLQVAQLGSGLAKRKARCWYTPAEWSELALRLFVYAEPERVASRCVWEEPSTTVAPVLSVMEDVISS